MDGMFFWREIMKMNFEADVQSFLPQRTGTNALALRITELDLEFNLESRPRWGGNQREEQAERERRGVSWNRASWQLES